ncbi:alcohol dehydrogenase zinc-binding domain-containing protein [Paracoccidioides lutzii Pb01]|uniref:Alcohol dehydrogenase zinc-binding domain-containing protein n=1 Tax=Paracoccidioides lutzii (strain ATCC MYA-826 / Pb01) TaxID=502779 RepID=C1H3M4_PARBA|nr:alcohol dehydrogenase zinc-binding domain-containing protein [Paracoccidioides lutzii Pb01]EEH34318.1 alcohol dehydrogenase zinc-binding domain-containing protein [Paracoccidioides lutzii Pb01]
MASQSSIPPTIRTLSQPDPLKPDITLTTSPPPCLTPNNTTEHLIRVHATSPCAGELTWPSYNPQLFSKNIVPCYDLSGTVVVAPPNSPFPPGTPIWGRTNVNHSGNAREYTVAHTQELARRPRNVDETEAASVPLSAETAVQALFEHGGFAGLGEGEAGRERNKGKRLLVTAASGGVGVWLLQLAREAGVGGIVTVCGTGNVGLVKELGATEVIDYRKTGVREWVESGEGGGKVDLVVDCKGGDSLAQCWSAVKDGGVLLSICEPPEGRRPGYCAVKDVRSEFFIMVPRGEDLADVGRLFEEGKVRAVVDSVWKLEEYRAAFEKLDEGHSRGKIILEL